MLTLCQQEITSAIVLTENISKLNLLYSEFIFGLLDFCLNCSLCVITFFVEILCANNIFLTSMKGSLQKNYRVQKFLLQNLNHSIYLVNCFFKCLQLFLRKNQLAQRRIFYQELSSLIERKFCAYFSCARQNHTRQSYNSVFKKVK